MCGILSNVDGGVITARLICVSSTLECRNRSASFDAASVSLHLGCALFPKFGLGRPGAFTYKSNALTVAYELVQILLGIATEVKHKVSQWGLS
jgi:hypothetical protein